MYEIQHYLTPGDKRDLYVDWLEKLRDTTAKIAVVRRVARIELGNFGDHRFCRDGVWELRIDVSAGYRCITPSQEKRSYCCYAAVTNERRVRTSAVLAIIGRIGNKGITMKSRAHDDAMTEVYRKDPDFARQVINDILGDENGDQGELLIILRQMAKGFGGVQAVAEQAQLNPTQLYRTLSLEGNPALSSLSAILKAMGMRLSVQPIQAVHSDRMMAPRDGLEPPTQ